MQSQSEDDMDEVDLVTKAVINSEMCLATKAALLILLDSISDTSDEEDDDDEDNIDNSSLSTLLNIDSKNISLKPKLAENNNVFSIVPEEVQEDKGMHKILADATDSYFKTNLGMSRDTFDFILCEYKGIKMNKIKRLRLDVDNKQRDLMIFFYYLSTSCQINEITKKFELENSIICLNIIKKIERYIINNLENDFIKWPTTITEQKMLNKEFKQIFNDCASSSAVLSNNEAFIGCLAYKKIEIKNKSIIGPRNNSDDNEKLLIQTVIDSNRVFRQIETFYTMEDNTSEILIFQRSELYKKNSNYPLYPKYYIHSDVIERYTNVLHPYPEYIKNCIQLKHDKIGNAKLENFIENVFLKVENRFSRLQNLELFTSSSSELSSFPDPGNIYKCAIILHNICLNRDDYYEDTNEVQIKNEILDPFEN